MRRTSRAKIFFLLVGAALVALVAAGVADPTGASSNQKAYYYVGGHVFGIGEEQVYVIVRQSTLTVRYRDHGGTPRTAVFKKNVHTSIAWTVEGIGSAGGPILGLATAAPAANGSTAPPNAADAAYGASTPSPASPSPSPMLDAQGAGAAAGPMAELAPTSFVLSSIVSQMPDIGKQWSSAGKIALRYGSLMLRMNNVVTVPTGDQGSVVRIASAGNTELNGKIGIKGFGTASLRGGGSAAGLTFVESENKLLLGMNLTAASHGNARVKDRAGSYDLNVSIAIKLVRYIPGIPLYVGGPNFVPASGYLGATTAPDRAIYSTAVPDQMAKSAPTNTEFMPPPATPVTPYPSTLPEVSLPPIPIPESSGEPIASPPPPPTPTPTPTRY